MKKQIIKILFGVLLIAAGTKLYSVSFGNPFGVMNPDRKMTKQELIKATRLMAAAEFEAVQNYMQVAESIDDALAKKVFTDIANEERVHAGEFLRLLNYLDPEENEFYKKGAAEVEEEIKKLEPKPEQPKIDQEKAAKLEIDQKATKPMPTIKESEKKEPISPINVAVEAETVSIKATEPNIAVEAETISEKTTEPEVIKPETKTLETKPEVTTPEITTQEITTPEILEPKEALKEILEPEQKPINNKETQEQTQKPAIVEKIKNTEKKQLDKALIESEIEDVADPVEFNVAEEDENEITIEPTEQISKNNAIINPENITTKPLNPAKLVLQKETTTNHVASESKKSESENKQISTQEKAGTNHLDVKKLITEKLNEVLKPIDNKNNKNLPVASTKKI